MPTIENANIKQLIKDEIARANELTGKNDTSVHNAIDSLREGYKQNTLYEQVVGNGGMANGDS